jgi:acetyl-CoA C-acetyltransferase
LLAAVRTARTSIMTVFVLGGAQTDFARHWSREGHRVFDLMRASVTDALEATRVRAADVGVGHVGNFTAELFCHQGQLGGLFASIDPAFAGLPTARHEAACASGSIAVLAATAELEAGRYDVACVVGVEQMRNVPGDVAAAHLGVAAWDGREGLGARFLWPAMFAKVADVYAERWGLAHEHLMQIAQKNFANAKKNPLAQTRAWEFGPASFTESDAHNPVVEGRLRRQDCGQLTDGAATVLLASERFARDHAARTGRTLSDLPRILGWGHRTAPMLLEDKLAVTGAPLLFPHVRGTLEDAWRRAGVAGTDQIDAMEVHDCFSITEYMICDHLGIEPPGHVGRAIEAGVFAPGGKLPINPSGGLIGLGHPVGATGVRMLLDAARQVSGAAQETQVDGARRVQTLNLGGSATTLVSFVVGR